MKKLYAAAALFLAAFTGANAQTTLPHVDIQALVIIDSMQQLNPTTGKGISWRAAMDNTINPFDSIRGAALVTISPNGGNLYGGDKIWYITPGNVVSSTGVSGWVLTINQGDSVETDPALLTPVTVDRDLKVTDSVMTLLNIDSFNTPGVNLFSHLLVPRENLVIGKVYGFYVYARPQPTTSGAEDYQFRDTIPANNWDYVPVIWGQGVGIGGSKFSTQYDNMEVYPNPAVGGTINYSFEAKKASNYQIVRVLDLTGREVMAVRNSAVTVGNMKGNIDVSKLAAGTYSIQVITEYGVAATKFVKN